MLSASAVCASIMLLNSDCQPGTVRRQLTAFEGEAARPPQSMTDLERRAKSLPQGITLRTPSWRDSVTAVASGPKHETLLCSYGNQVVLWQWPEARRVRSWTGVVAGSVAFVPKSPIVTWDTGAHIVFADIDSGRTWQSQGTHKNIIHDITVDPSGERLASASADGEVRVWDVHSGGPILALKTPSDSSELKVGTSERAPSSERMARENWSIAFSSDGKRIATGGNAGLVRMWNAKTGAFLRTYMLPTGSTGRAGKVEVVSFRPEGFVAVLSREWTKGSSVYRDVLLWNVEKESIEVVCPGPEIPYTSGISAAAFSRDGHFLAVGFSGDSFVRIWQLSERPKLVEVLPASGGNWGVGAASALTFAPDSKHLAIGTTGPTLNIWSVPEPSLRASMPLGTIWVDPKDTKPLFGLPAGAP